MWLEYDHQMNSPTSLFAELVNLTDRTVLSFSVSLSRLGVMDLGQQGVPSKQRKSMLWWLEWNEADGAEVTVGEYF